MIFQKQKKTMLEENGNVQEINIGLRCENYFFTNEGSENTEQRYQNRVNTNGHRVLIPIPNPRNTDLLLYSMRSFQSLAKKLRILTEKCITLLLQKSKSPKSLFLLMFNYSVLFGVKIPIPKPMPNLSLLSKIIIISFQPIYPIKISMIFG